jgi:hypothetical protein
MTLNDKSGSRDIAQHIRETLDRCRDNGLDEQARRAMSSPAVPEWFETLVGDSEPPKPRRFPWVLVTAFAFAFAGLVAGYAFGEVPPDYEPPRGYEACTGLC